MRVPINNYKGFCEGKVIVSNATINNSHETGWYDGVSPVLIINLKNENYFLTATIFLNGYNYNWKIDKEKTIERLSYWRDIVNCKGDYEMIAEKLIGKEFVLREVDNSSLNAIIESPFIGIDRREDEHPSIEEVDEMVDFFVEEGHAYLKGDDYDDSFEKEKSREDKEAWESDPNNYPPVFSFPYFLDKFICWTYEVKCIDSIGNVVRVDDFDHEGELVKRTVFDYDIDRNLRIKIIHDNGRSYIHNSEDVTGTSYSLLYPLYSYEYDNRGNLIKEEYDDGPVYDEFTYQYNESNQLVTSYDRSGCQTTYYYDEDLLLSTITVQNGKAISSEGMLFELISIVKYKFNSSRQKVEKEVYWCAEGKSVITKYRYDQKGELVDETTTEKEGQTKL